MSSLGGTAGLDRATNALLIRLMRTAAIVLAVLFSGFVLSEPAPYELWLAGLIPIWALFGLRLSRHIAPLITLLVLFNIGGLIAMTQMEDLAKAPLYIAVSLFLALTSIFFGAVVESDEKLISVIFKAWVFTAVGTAALGILGYFNAVPGASLFTRYGRATGGFEDPNVFGPFLCLPGLFLLHRVMTATPRAATLAVLPLFIIVLGIFLSFSRGAWGLFFFGAVLVTLALFVQHRQGATRLRIILMCIAAVGALAIGIVVALQIPAIATLLEQRAQLVQDYDGERMGRFARFALGFQLALEKPFGIGPLVFGPMFGEDTHNIWLKTLMDYSWLGFASYLTLVIWTIVGGFRILLRDRPWQPYLLCAYAAFLGHTALGSIIDTDHWRHLYLILGLIWGMMALEQRHQALLRGSDRAVRAH
jgi:O-antigen ligase